MTATTGTSDVRLALGECSQMSPCQSLALRHREPDALDELRARHEARRLAHQLKHCRSG
jgi:hypothetical protein